MNLGGFSARGKKGFEQLFASGNERVTIASLAPGMK
jgi:hypothetical protein